MNIDYILQRFSDNRESTLGILLKKTNAGTVFQAYTLEDQFQEVKLRAETRIPAGKYEIIIQRDETPKTLSYRKRYSWFKSHLMLRDVPGFIGIYIHIGNTDVDTEGCILLGDNADNNVIGPGSVSNSTACFMRFYKGLYDHLDHKFNGKYDNTAYIDIRDETKLL